MRQGHVRRAEALLAEEDIAVIFVSRLRRQPRCGHGRGRAAGRGAAAGVDSIVALGGGSSLDCAKGINFVLTNGGSMRDYRGFGKAARPMLPSIGMPTTAGTGSEAQSYAIISDAETHAKMACGDPKAAFRVAILDPTLTVTQPRDGDRRGRVRCDVARGRGVRDDEADGDLGAVRARRVAAARGATTSAC